LRGRQSAAILVVKVNGSSMPWHDRIVDLRVEDHPQPLVEMRRLLKIQQAFVHANNGDLMTEKGDIKRALEEYRRSAELCPENAELRFWQAVSLIDHGELDKGKAILKKVYRSNRDMRTLMKNLVPAGLLKV